MPRKSLISKYNSDVPTKLYSARANKEIIEETMQDNQDEEEHMTKQQHISRARESSIVNNKIPFSMLPSNTQQRVISEQMQQQIDDETREKEANDMIKNAVVIVGGLAIGFLGTYLCKKYLLPGNPISEFSNEFQKSVSPAVNSIGGQVIKNTSKSLSKNLNKF